ncbi:MAG: alpha/beta hydrolase [Candidatus Accumulibacter sp.]|nr:alpha/beta hydrolase [Accumulibacter sp.]
MSEPLSPEPSTIGENTPAHSAETVILIHGLWTPALVFALHSHWLKGRGYRTRRYGYHSVRASLSDNAFQLKSFVAQTDAETIHLVGHSLGGLIILEMLLDNADPRLKRAVLLGTPCHDSYCGRQLIDLPLLPSLLGLSTMEWLSRGPAIRSVQGSMVEIGVVAGTRSVGLGRVVPDLPLPNDGLVGVDETRLVGATDFITLPVAHSEMLASRLCAEQIAAFLETGRFIHAATAENPD